MRKIKIVTDSACDIPKELEERYGILILPFAIIVGDKSYTERKDFTNEEFYQILSGHAEDLYPSEHRKIYVSVLVHMILESGIFRRRVAVGRDLAESKVVRLHDELVRAGHHNLQYVIPLYDRLVVSHDPVNLRSVDILKIKNLLGSSATYSHSSHT